MREIASNQVLFRYNTAVAGESNPNTRALLGARARRKPADWITPHPALDEDVQFPLGERVSLPVQLRRLSGIAGEEFGPEININGFGHFNRDALLPSRLLWRRQQVAEKLSLSRGAHLFKIGGEFLLRSNSSKRMSTSRDDSISESFRAPS